MLFLIYATVLMNKSTSNRTRKISPVACMFYIKSVFYYPFISRTLETSPLYVSLTIENVVTEFRNVSTSCHS